MHPKTNRRAFYHLATVTLAATGLLAGASPSHAYRMIQNPTVGRVTEGVAVTCNDPDGFAHWTQSDIPWRLNPTGQGAGKTLALQNATAAWSGVPNANHGPRYLGTTEAGWATDGVNTVLWATGNGCVGHCLALTALVLQSDQVIVESDITFNASYAWYTTGWDYDAEAIAAHELGHSLGIHHTELTSTPTPTMNSSYFGTDGRTLESDDHAALQCSQSMYPVTGQAPPIPAYLDVFPESCRSLVTLEWTPSLGASYYEVQRSANSNFTSPVLIYSGPETSLFHNGGSGTQWYRVRACNGPGCSGYRNGDEPVYYSLFCT